MSKLKKLRPRCFFDISIDGQNVGRIIFELFNETCPKTCENFKALCTGEKGIGKNTNKLLHYKNVPFHRIINGFMIQSGDFSQMNGKGGESIYGGTFNDESFHFKHDRPFLLSMANRGPNTNGSQFFITLVPTPHLDGVHVVFGHVIAGQDVVMKIAQQSVDKNSRPLLPVLISNCGELVPKIVPKDDKKATNKHHSRKNSDQDSESSSSDDSDSDSSAEDSSNSESDNDSSGKIDKTNDSKNNDNTIESNENSISLFNPKYNVRIDPNEIPEIPKNRFLERNKPPNNDVNNNNKEQTNDRKYSRQTSSKDRFYEKRIKYTRSGRKIKGRGSIHYRTPSPEYDDDRRHYRRQYSSRRESTYRRQRRSETPLHWRVEQAKIKTWKEIISNSRKDKSNDKDKHRSRSRSLSRSSSPKNDRKHRRDSYTRRHDHTSEHRRKHRSKSPSRSSKHSRRIDENGEDDKRRKFREYPSPEINDKITKSQFEKENNYNSTNHHHKK